MKLNKVTIEVLKNMATINQGIIIKPGSTLRTRNIVKSVMLVAEIPDEFPVEFAIYDLNEFLGVYSLAEDPEIEFTDDRLVITTETDVIEYFYSSPSIVVAPKDSKIKFPDPTRTFTLKVDSLDKILKNSSVMKLKDIEIGAGELLASNVAASGRTGNTFKHKLTDVETLAEPVKPMIIDIDNLKLIGCDYNVSVSDKGLCKFESDDPDYNLTYYIALK